MQQKSNFRVAGLAAAALLLAGVLPVRAQNTDDLQRAVARLSLVNGDVSVERGDTNEWVAAVVNTPLLTGDRISTAPNSRAEVEFDAGTVLRVGGDAVVALTELEYDRYQMDLLRGTVTFRVLRSSNTDIELDTSSVSVRPSKIGSYRIAVNDAGETDLTARSGEVEVFTPRGSQWVSAGQTMIARGAASDPEIQIVRAGPADEWDRWNDGRDRPLTASTSYQYVPPGVYGTEDLDPYGSWVNVPQYGNVWRPVVAADWAPYHYGRWVWADWYGWTWVSADPWGWAPYHYGRWFYEPAYGWCWYPGAIGVRHYWSPALVAFFGFGGGGVGLGVGFGNVGWVPLAPYEVLHPWWGRAYYGHGGYINRSINVTNINVVNTYRNSVARNGFTAVSGEDFRAGHFNNYVRASTADLRAASFARGTIPVTPDRSNLQFSERSAAFVPRNVGNGRVFSYHQPAPAARLSFDEQRRSFGGGGGQTSVVTLPGRSAGNGVQTSGAPSVNSAGERWRRFGDPASSTRPELRQTQPSVRSTQPSRSETATPAPNRGWTRFGEPGANSQNNHRESQRSEPRTTQYNAPARNENVGSFQSGQQSLRIVPQVVRERPASNYGSNAPRSGGFGAPRGEPRSSGSRSSGGGGGGHGGGGGGGGGGGHGR